MSPTFDTAPAGADVDSALSSNECSHCRAEIDEATARRSTLFDGDDFCHECFGRLLPAELEARTLSAKLRHLRDEASLLLGGGAVTIRKGVAS